MSKSSKVIECGSVWLQGCVFFTVSRCQVTMEMLLSEPTWRGVGSESCCGILFTCLSAYSPQSLQGCWIASAPGCLGVFLCDDGYHMPMWTQNVGDAILQQPPQTRAGHRVPWAVHFLQGSWILQGTRALANSVLVEHSFHSCFDAWLQQTAAAPCSVCGQPGISGGPITYQSAGGPAIRRRSSAGQV